jgi:uracil phosphoribosyltransferase
MTGPKYRRSIYLIPKLTLENQIVFDPMMGTGTTGIAALKLKRQFLGLEKETLAKIIITTSTDNSNNPSENL